MEGIKLQVCPSCQQKSLMLNPRNDKYECLNLQCRDSYHRVTIDKFNETGTKDTALKSQSPRRATAWFGNQYYDTKKKRWRDAKFRRIGIGNSNNWIWSIILFVLISFILTLVLNYFYPGSRFLIIGF